MLLLSTTAIFIRHITQTSHLPPITLAFWRNALALASLTMGLGVFSPRRLLPQRLPTGHYLLHGLVMAVFNTLWTVSVSLNGAASATVLVYTSGGFTALLGWAFLKEKPRRIHAFVLIMSLMGCVLVSEAGSQASALSPTGAIAGLLSGAAYAVYSLMGRRASVHGGHSWTTLLYALLPATVVLGLATSCPGSSQWGGGNLLTAQCNASAWVCLALLAAGPTVLGFGLYNMALQRLPAVTVNLTATLEPLFTLLTAGILLGEHFTPTQLGGGALILSGVALLAGGRSASQIKSEIPPSESPQTVLTSSPLQENRP